MQDILDLALISQYLHPGFLQPVIKNPGALGKNDIEDYNRLHPGQSSKRTTYSEHLTSLHSDTFAKPSLQLHCFFRA